MNPSVLLNPGHRENEVINSPLRIAMLIASSGSASTLKGVTGAIDEGVLNADIQLVVSNKKSKTGHAVAKKHSLVTWVHNLPWNERKSEKARKVHSSALAQELSKNQIEVAVLAGWPIILQDNYFEEFDGITLNIHPGLIPDEEDEVVTFPDGTEAPWNRGLMTDDAIERFLGGTYGGSTIHHATTKTDFGPVLKRVFTKVRKEDTVDTLYPRLKKKEQKGLIGVLSKIQRDGNKDDNKCF